MIDALYHVYRQENPNQDKLDALKKAVLVGFNMHSYYMSKIEEKNNIYELAKEAYKIGLNEYHKNTQSTYKNEHHDIVDYGKIEKTIENHGYFNGFHETENTKRMDDLEIEKIAKMLGTSLSHKYKEYEIALINILYKSYQNSFKTIDLTDLKIKAVSIGLYFHSYQFHKGYSHPLKDKDFEKTYKIALGAYHSIEKIGNFYKAFDHSCALHHEQKLEKFLDHTFNNHDHYQNNKRINQHINNTYYHMQHYENHLEKIYEQQKQHDVQHQNRIDVTRHFDGFER